MSQQAINLDSIRSALAASEIRFGATLQWHATVETTMPLAWALVDDPMVASGAAVVADEQTAGKGRQGRTWVAPPALGLLVSYMLRRAECSVALGRLHMAAALALVDLCQCAGIDPDCIRIKWPNDVVLLNADRAPHKVAGILVETRLAGSDWESAVIGMGINVNQTHEELPPPAGAALPATSLWLARGEAYLPLLDRSQLFVALCESLQGALSLSSDEVLRQWQSRLWIPQGEVQVTGSGAHYAGRMLGADEEGALLLQDANGVIHHLPAGDLSLRPYTR